MDDSCDLNTVGKEEIENEIIPNGSASHIIDEFRAFSAGAGIIGEKQASFFDLFDYSDCGLRIVGGYIVVNFLQVVSGSKCEI
jgi:hypothetical protein